MNMKKSDYKWMNLSYFKCNYTGELQKRKDRCIKNNGVPDEKSFIESPHKFLDFQGLALAENPKITLKDSSGSSRSGYAFRAENLATAFELLGCIRSPLTDMYGSNDVYEANHVYDTNSLLGKNYKPFGGRHLFYPGWGALCIKDPYIVSPWGIEADWIIGNSIGLRGASGNMAPTGVAETYDGEVPMVPVTGFLGRFDKENYRETLYLNPIFGLALMLRSLDFDINRDWEYLSKYTTEGLPKPLGAAINVKMVKSISSYIDSGFDTGACDVTKDKGAASYAESVLEGVSGMCNGIVHFSGLISDEEINNLSTSAKLGRVLNTEDFVTDDKKQRSTYARLEWKNTESILKKLGEVGKNGFYITDRQWGFPRGNFYYSKDIASRSVYWDGGDPGFTFTRKVYDLSTKSDSKCTYDEESGSTTCVDTITFVRPDHVDTKVYTWDDPYHNYAKLYSKAINAISKSFTRKDEGVYTTYTTNGFKSYTKFEEYAGGKIPFVYEFLDDMDRSYLYDIYKFKNHTHEFHPWVDVSNSSLYIGITVTISFNIIKVHDMKPAEQGRKWERSIKFIAQAPFSRTYVATRANGQEAWYGVWELDAEAAVNRIKSYVGSVSFNDIGEDVGQWEHVQRVGPDYDDDLDGDVILSEEGTLSGDISIEAEICEYPSSDNANDIYNNARKGRPPRFFGPVYVIPG